MEYRVTGFLSHGGGHEVEEFSADSDGFAREKLRAIKEGGRYIPGTIELVRIVPEAKPVVIQRRGT